MYINLFLLITVCHHIQHCILTHYILFYYYFLFICAHLAFELHDYQFKVRRLHLLQPLLQMSPKATNVTCCLETSRRTEWTSVPLKRFVSPKFVYSSDAVHIFLIELLRNSTKNYSLRSKVRKNHFFDYIYFFSSPLKTFLIFQKALKVIFLHINLESSLPTIPYLNILVVFHSFFIF